jgi:hypothetical protein
MSFGLLSTLDINLEHFRQLVVNSVMATDIMDKGQRLSLCQVGQSLQRTPTKWIHRLRA